MTLDACAALIERGDPDRFAALLAAPRTARAALLPLYALNLEVARAPWVTSEPMIAEMRLQWWRDAVAEPAPRAHEVAGPLHALTRDKGLCVDTLDRLIAARRWDIYRDAFDDEAAFDGYIDDTAGGLMWLGAVALGAPPQAEAPVRDYAFAAGLAAFLRAVPELEARGRIPLVDGRVGAVAQLALRGLIRLRQARAGRKAIPRTALPALLPGWQAEGVLTIAARDPGAVGAGAIGVPEITRRGRLMWQSLTGLY
jgi:phytoene synthase